jgi:Uma2 family endonuclease
MGTPTKPITYEDSLTMPENRLEEIVHGESRIMPPVTFFHACLIRMLSKILEAQLHSREYSLFGGDVGLGIERSPLTCRIPDLMVFQMESLRQERAQAAVGDPYVWTAPDLIVECLSPSNRKGAVRELLADYEQIAVPEVWLLDPALPQFTSYRYESGTLRHSQAMDYGRVIPVLLPNVSVDLADLWAAFDGSGLGL